MPTGISATGSTTFNSNATFMTNITVRNTALAVDFVLNPTGGPRVSIASSINDFKQQILALQAIPIVNYQPQIDSLTVSMSSITATTQGQIYELQLAFQAELTARLAFAQSVITLFNNSIAGPNGQQNIGLYRSVSNTYEQSQGGLVDFNQVDYTSNLMSYNIPSKTVTVQVPGVYEVETQVSFAPTFATITKATLRILLNGVVKRASCEWVAMQDDPTFRLQANRNFQLVAGDVVSVTLVFDQPTNYVLLGDPDGVFTSLYVTRVG